MEWQIGEKISGLITQARRQAETILDYPALEARDGLKDVATEWLEVVANIETNHHAVVEEVALVRDSLHKRNHFDLGKLKVLESSLDNLLELTASFLEYTSSGSSEVY